MHDVNPSQANLSSRVVTPGVPRMVVGITSAQTCVVLRGRLRALREAGFHVTLVSSPGALLDGRGRDEGVETVSVPMEREIALVRDSLSLLRLWRFLRQIHPDVVEFSTPKAGLLGMLASKLARVPRRIYLMRGLKLETATGLKREILRMAERLTVACAHTVLCNSESLRQRAADLGIGPAAKMQVLGSGSSVGVDLERFSPGISDVRERFGLPLESTVLGFVGRLTRDKGVPELLDAFEQLLWKRPDTYLMLVGWFDAAEDALGKALRNRIVSHPRIVCTGFVPDTAPYYRAMDIMILPTLREGFPNAVLEASASGLPVISTLSTGACDAVVPEVTGLLVPAACPEAIVEAAGRLLGDMGLRMRMGTAGRAWVTERFAHRDVLGRNTRFYRDLMEPRNSTDFASRPH